MRLVCGLWVGEGQQPTDCAPCVVMCYHGQGIVAIARQAAHVIPVTLVEAGGRERRTQLRVLGLPLHARSLGVGRSADLWSLVRYS